MRQTIRLGRISGIPVGANGSVLVIVAIVVLSLAGARFPATDPGRGVFAYLLAAVLAAAALLLSLLAHEVGHAVVARANGLGVDSITLWMLGGVAQLRGAVRTARAEFLVAVVGPLVSLVLGGVFGLLAVGAGFLTEDRLVVATLAYLSWLNVVLAVFNMVPAAPLDGGRVMMAVVWRFTGDRTRAAVAAARAGRATGLLLIVAGITLLLVTGAFGGLWLALIGWFLVHAAAAEEEHSRAGALLAGLRVAEVMTPNPFTARADPLVEEFVSTVAMRHRFSSYPIVDEWGQLTGLVTLNRLRDVRAGDLDNLRLGDIACPARDVPTAAEDELLVEVLPRLSGCDDGRAVVMDEHGRVIGIVSPSDISRAMALADLRGAQPYPAGGADLVRRSPRG